MRHHAAGTAVNRAVNVVECPCLTWDEAGIDGASRGRRGGAAECSSWYNMLQCLCHQVLAALDKFQMFSAKGAHMIALFARDPLLPFALRG